MVIACDQQTSQAFGAASRAIRHCERKTAGVLRRPDRGNPIFTAAIRLARRRAKWSPDSKSSTRTLCARSVSTMRTPAVLAHHSAWKTFGPVRASIYVSACQTKMRRSLQQYLVPAVNFRELILRGAREMKRIARPKKYRGSSLSNTTHADRCFSPSRRRTAELFYLPKIPAIRPFLWDFKACWNCSFTKLGSLA